MDRSGGIVANVNSETGPDAASAPATRKMPSEANARLIAAAPDMLAALQWAFRCWETGAWKNEDGQTPDIEPIKAAIAKATGEK